VTRSARGGHFSKGLAGYNIGSVQQFLKHICTFTSYWQNMVNFLVLTSVCFSNKLKIQETVCLECNLNRNTVAENKELFL
jgi:hypothetical protein